MSEQPAAAVAEPAVETQVAPKAKTSRRSKRQPPYNVILLNDDDHTVTYVVRMMLQLFGHPEPKGLQLAEAVHHQGRAIVLTTTREHAELKRDQIHAFGKDVLVAECRGSMSAEIEPVE